eukprot:scaffold60738_cov68-Cyclotella_meneghiniana.AAC.2
MARGQSGKQLVTLAITATVSAIGIGTIYLPFIADRDKLRGLFEEGEEQIPEGARREIRDIMRKEAQQQQEQQEQQQRQHDVDAAGKKGSSSMWSSFRRS